MKESYLIYLKQFMITTVISSIFIIGYILGFEFHKKQQLESFIESTQISIEDLTRYDNLWERLELLENNYNDINNRLTLFEKRKLHEDK